jgi:hypothetical protein
MYTLTEAVKLSQAEVGAESQALGQHPALLGRAFVIGAAFEEAYYRGANLPETLGRLFAVIRPDRIDEDALEPLCQQAQALVRTSALLDDHVQHLYRALHNSGLDSGELHLRRPSLTSGQRRSEGAQLRPPGTAALHALKRLWASDWQLDEVIARLDLGGSVGLEARPTLVLGGPAGQLDPGLTAELGQPAWSNAGRLVGLGRAEPVSADRAASLRR